MDDLNKRLKLLSIATTALAVVFVLGFVFLWDHANQVSEQCVTQANFHSNTVKATKNESGLDELRPLSPEEEDGLNGGLNNAELLTLSENLNYSRSIAGQSKGSVRLRWRAHPGASFYHVRAWQIVGGMKQLLINKPVKSTSVKLELKTLDTIFWQLAIVDQEGKESAFSDPETINPLQSH